MRFSNRALTIAAAAVSSLVVASCADDSGSTDSTSVTSPATPATSAQSDTTTVDSTTRPVDTAAPTTSEAAAVGRLETVQFDGELIDDSRNRRIPYRVFAPVGLAGDVPVILVSHGGFGSDIAYQSGGYLGLRFAQGGFLAVHIGHLPSADGRVQLDDRPADVTFLLDQLEAGTMALPAEFTGTADLERVGFTGHSYGAYTAHAVAGATYGRTYTDPRIDAIAPISPQGPEQFGAFDNGPNDNTWMTVEVPVFVLIGGAEINTNALDTVDRPGWRLAPFQNYPGTADTFQTIVDGRSHSDMWRTGSNELRAFMADEILAFMQVYVVGDQAVDACSIGQVDDETVGPDVLPAIDTQQRPGTLESFIATCP